MRYPYDDATITVGDDDDVYVEVIFPDEGTTGTTNINIPGQDSKGLRNAGRVLIGKGKTLKGEDQTMITSSPYNIEPRIDKIRENIPVAGVQVVAHENLKSADTTPQIEVCITFV